MKAHAAAAAKGAQPSLVKSTCNVDTTNIPGPPLSLSIARVLSGKISQALANFQSRRKLH